MPVEPAVPVELRTERLLLRSWRDADLAPFAAMNADPAVMAYFVSVLSRAESDAAAARVRAHFAKHGWGWWALEIPGEVEFAGFVGLWHVPYDTPFTPAVEVGWRLAREHWNRGYATEAARAAVRFGFEDLGLAEIVSMTAVDNAPSRAVMAKLGMTRDPRDDFDHPRLAPDHPLRRHVLYRLRPVTSSPGHAVGGS